MNKMQRPSPLESDIWEEWCHERNKAGAEKAGGPGSGDPPASGS